MREQRRHEAERRELSLIPGEAPETVPGRGVKNRVNGRLLAAGSARFMQDLGLSAVDGAQNAVGSLVFLADLDAGQVLGKLEFRDQAKDGAGEAVAGLKALGARVLLLSGDRMAAARANLRSSHFGKMGPVGCRGGGRGVFSCFFAPFFCGKRSRSVVRPRPAVLRWRAPHPGRALRRPRSARASPSGCQGL